MFFGRGTVVFFFQYFFDTLDGCSFPIDVFQYDVGFWTGIAYDFSVANIVDAEREKRIKKRGRFFSFFFAANLKGAGGGALNTCIMSSIGSFSSFSFFISSTEELSPLPIWYMGGGETTW